VVASMLATTTVSALLGASPAWAHARVVTSSPGEGAVVASVASARVVFSESVSGGGDALRILTASGRSLSQPARVSGSVVTASATSALPAGRYALAYRVISEDGHVISNARGFSVRLADPVSAPRTVTLSGTSVSLSGTRVGTRSLKLKGELRRAIGQVVWRLPGFPEPFEWSLTKGKAAGMLPFPGTYSVTVTAYSSASSTRTLTGVVRISP